MTSMAGLAGVELASLLKSSLQFRKPDGVKVPGLRLTDDAMQAWLDLTFGLFIHCGLYALVDRGEWPMFNDRVPAEAYAARAQPFKPRYFDAQEWSGSPRAPGRGTR